MPIRINNRSLTRRSFLSAGATGLALAGVSSLPLPALAQSGRLEFTHGLQTGDVSADSAVLWARADRPARMWVEVATSDSFKNARLLRGPAAIEASDFTAKMPLSDLPAGQTMFCRVKWENLADSTVMSEPLVCRFRTAPAGRQSVAFVWSGDTAGQGWGINEDWGGMRCYETMRSHNPDFFIHSGDTVYADGPIAAEVELPDGTMWKNIVTEEKSKVAETLAEFRGNFKYNLLDANVRRLNAEVPMFAQWDDHEVLNNWYPGEVLSDDRYTEKNVSLLAARANRAFMEFMPVRQPAEDRERVYRQIQYGPLLDILFLDMRSYRAANGANDQAEPGPDTAFLGAQQIRWLKQALLASKATWKVIASDMPIGLIVYDDRKDKSTFENCANGDGPVRGREHEIADLLRFMKQNKITNTVWLTADVHYTAAHHYSPDRAQFQDFDPFWEFVSGPLHAGSFGPNELDNTFGPEVRYTKNPEGRANLPPSAGLQFFGHVAIDGDTEVMTVTLRDLEDTSLFSVSLDPVL